MKQTWCSHLIKYSLILLVACVQPITKKDLSNKGPMFTTPDLKIFYSNDLAGKLESCGCASSPKGGLARRYEYLKRQRSLEQKIGRAALWLQVDSGNLFFPSAQSSGMSSIDWTNKQNALWIAKSLGQTGLHFFSPAAQDFAYGLNTLDWLKQHSSFTFVTSNLFRDEDRTVPLYQPWGEWEIEEGQKLLVLSAYLNSITQPIPEGVWLKEAASALAQTYEQYLKHAAGRAPLWTILLTNGTPEQLQELLAALTPEKTPFFQALFLAGNYDVYDPPLQKSGHVIAQTLYEGQKLGLLHFKNINQTLNQKIAKVQNWLWATQEYWQQLQTKQKQLSEQIALLAPEVSDPQRQAIFEKAQSAQQTLNTLSTQYEPLFFEAEQVELLAQYQQENIVLNSLREHQKMLSEGIQSKSYLKNQNQQEKSLEKSATNLKSTYFSPQSCKECHQEQYHFWQTTQHANALLSLHSKGRVLDPTCIRCHSTSLGEVTQFAEPTQVISTGQQNFLLRDWLNQKVMQEHQAIDPKNNWGAYQKLSRKYQAEIEKLNPEHNFAGIQCTVCHQVSAAHFTLAALKQPARINAVVEETCLKCHDGKNSDPLNWMLDRAKIACPANGKKIPN